MITTALIISTYNWPEALHLCLLSVKLQSVLPSEIIIADDGSAKQTKEVVDNFREAVNTKVKYVWQEDKGFRLSRIRNLAINETKSDYLIFIDGDVILHRNFVNDHILFRQNNTFLTGSRVLLSAKYSHHLIVSKNVKINKFLFSAKNRLNGIRSLLFAKIVSKKNEGIFNVRGCNMSFWTNDIKAVNGFEEQFEGWGREDSDIVQRLFNLGREKLKIKFVAVQYHLYHKENGRDNLQKNDQLVEYAKKNGKIESEIGLTQLRL